MLVKDVQTSSISNSLNIEDIENLSVEETNKTGLRESLSMKKTVIIFHLYFSSNVFSNYL